MGYTSNSKLFAKRGDPWVTRKEGIKDFQRNLDTEDAEYDFDHRYHSAGNIKGKPTLAQPRADERREARRVEAKEMPLIGKLANIRQKYRKREQGVKITARGAEATRVGCPYRCGFSAHDSRAVSLHLRERIVCKCGFTACNPKELERHKRNGCSKSRG